MIDSLPVAGTFGAFMCLLAAKLIDGLIKCHIVYGSSSPLVAQLLTPLELQLVCVGSKKSSPPSSSLANSNRSLHLSQ